MITTSDILHGRDLAEPLALEVAQRRSVDWAREFPEEEFVRIAAGWRVMIIAAAALVGWTAVAGVVVTSARVFGII